MHKLCQGYGEYLSILRGLPDFIDGVEKAWDTIKDRKVDIDEYVDSIGDQWVTIVIGMEMAGVSYQDASVLSREISSPASVDDIVSSISLISDGMLIVQSDIFGCLVLADSIVTGKQIGRAHV